MGTTVLRIPTGEGEGGRREGKGEEEREGLWEREGWEGGVGKKRGGRRNRKVFYGYKSLGEKFLVKLFSKIYITPDSDKPKCQ